MKVNKKEKTLHIIYYFNHLFVIYDAIWYDMRRYVELNYWPQFCAVES